VSAEVPRNDNKSKRPWTEQLLAVFGSIEARLGRWRNCVREMKFKDWTDFFTAAGTVLVGLTLFVLIGQYFEQELTNRLTRTSDALKTAESSVKEEEHRHIIRAFPGRWQREVKICLAKEEAEAFLAVAIQPDKDPGKFKRWDLARKYLNRIETIAFPYVYDLANRKILATSACGSVTRSNRYFVHLITIFGRYFGGGQSWQVIPRAGKMMEDEWGTNCAKLSSEQDRTLKLIYQLPPQVTEPADGESTCPPL
jgi:hypothetical protein